MVSIFLSLSQMFNSFTEQQFVELERRVVDTEARLENKSSLCTKLEQDLKNNGRVHCFRANFAESLLENARSQLSELQSQRGEHSSTAQQLHQISESLREDLRQARDHIERLRLENENLKSSYGFGRRLIVV